MEFSIPGTSAFWGRAGQDGQNARPHCSAVAVRPRRCGDRANDGMSALGPKRTSL